MDFLVSKPMCHHFTYVLYPHIYGLQEMGASNSNVCLITNINYPRYAGIVLYIVSHNQANLLVEWSTVRCGLHTTANKKESCRNEYREIKRLSINPFIHQSRGLLCPIFSLAVACYISALELGVHYPQHNGPQNIWQVQGWEQTGGRTAWEYTLSSIYGQITNK